MNRDSGHGWASAAPSGQAEVVTHYPHTVQSGWMPRSADALRAFHQQIASAERGEYAKSIAELNDFINSEDVLKYLVANACKQNRNLVEAYPNADSTGGVVVPRIEDQEALLHGFNALMNHAPGFINDELVGLPFSAWVVGIDPTLSGVSLLGLPMFNEKMSAVLKEWFGFLGTPASASGFEVEGRQWLSPTAKEMYQFEDWQKDQSELPYWTSWNSFFTRQFKDRDQQRPIAGPDTNRIAIAANDGSLFRWDSDVSERDVYWFKDMRYSLADILSSPIPEQQSVIDEYGLVDMFKGGYVFQTYLNPYNFHRWWVPVNGEVLFDPLAVPGAFFNKLVIPDFGGATTASLPYLTEINARGIIVFKTEDYGHVCAIPLGMSETSTITFDGAMCKGATASKGQEMGMFNYGGSSFVLIYENLPNKKLVFMNGDGDLLPQVPQTASSSAATGGVVTNIGAQVGQWVEV